MAGSSLQMILSVDILDREMTVLSVYRNFLGVSFSYILCRLSVIVSVDSFPRQESDFTFAICSSFWSLKCTPLGYV